MFQEQNKLRGTTVNTVYVTLPVSSCLLSAENLNERIQRRNQESYGIHYSRCPLKLKTFLVKSIYEAIACVVQFGVQPFWCQSGFKKMIRNLLVSLRYVLPKDARL